MEYEGAPAKRSELLRVRSESPRVRAEAKNTEGSVKYTCPFCGRVLLVGKFRGTFKLKCKRCGRVFQLTDK